MKYKIDFDALGWESTMKGVRHKIFPFQDRRLRLVEYSPEMEPHWCERGHTGYIIEGLFQIEFADGTQVFRAGDGVVIPGGPGNRHMARVSSGIVRAIFIENV